MAPLPFADLDLLRRALESGAVPPAVGRAPAKVGFDGRGTVWVEPEAPLGDDALAELDALGVRPNPACPVPLDRAAYCWAALLPPRPGPPRPADPARPVVFDLPADQLPRLAALVRRLRRQPLLFR